MKRVWILLLLVNVSLYAESTTSSRYGITQSIHSKETQQSVNEELVKKRQKENELTHKIKEIVDFMENFKLLSSKQRKEATQFQTYVNAHLASIASCKNLEEDFQMDLAKAPMSNEEIELYQEEIEECKSDLKESKVSYSQAKIFFDEALRTLNTLKVKNKLASKRYTRLQTSISEVSTMIEYLKSTR